MLELIYYSIAQPWLNSEDILNILKTSREFNIENNITGCLLYFNNEFIQILEGEKNIVKYLYGKIEQDKRHHHVMLLVQNEKESRSFTNWGMAFYDPGSRRDDDVDKQLFIKNFTALSTLTDKPTHAVKLFWHISTLLLME